MKELVYMAPITTGMAVTKGLQGYNWTNMGIIDDPECCDQIVQPLCANRNDHEVTVIGYGRENNKDYWLAKNSWGPFNGGDMNGIFKIKRGTGHCGFGHWSFMPRCRAN